MSVSLSLISQKASQLIQSCQETTPLLETAGRVDEVVQRHRELKNQYDAFHRNFNELGRRISSSGDVSSTHEATVISDRVESAWHELEDQLLTAYPQARIDYGRPLLGELEPAPNLMVSADLKARYPAEQKVRGDGNCFYTSFTINYLQRLCRNPNQIEILLARLLDMPNFPGKEEVVSLLMNLEENPASLQDHLRSTSDMFPFISFLRHAAALQMTATIQEWRPFYLPESAQDPQTAEEYVANHVLKMGCDAQHYEINAICAFLGCQVWIIDHQNGLRKINEESDLFVGAIYRSPGHYSCLQSQLPPGNPCNTLAGTIVTIALPVIAAYFAWKVFF